VKADSRDPAVGLVLYRRVVDVFGVGARSAARLENGRQLSNSQLDPPHIGHLSGAARRLAPYAHAAQRKRNSGPWAFRRWLSNPSLPINAPKNTSRRGLGGRLVSEGKNTRRLSASKGGDTACKE
jgi:hypothetical protein